MKNIIGHQELKYSDSTKAPFQNYILICDDTSGIYDAYEISPDAPLDLETLLNEIYSENEVEVCDHDFGSLSAKILLDYDEPFGYKCWTSKDFYIVA